MKRKMLLAGLALAVLLLGCSAETDVEPEATLSEAEEKPENETETQTEAEAEAEKGIQTETENEAEAEKGTQTEIENEAEAETETDTTSDEKTDESEDLEDETGNDPDEIKSDMLSARLMTVDLDLSSSLRPEVSLVSVKGKFTSTPYITNMYNRDVLSSELVGLFGCPVEVEFEGESAVLTFTIDEEQAGDVTADDLVVLMLSEDRTEFLEMESSKSENKISVNVESSGTYMLADMFIWYSVWGSDMSSYAHDTLYRDAEFGFSMTITEHISYGTVSDYWKAEDQGGCDLMVKRLIRQSNGDVSDMQLSMTAVRYPSEDESDSPMAVIELSENVEGIYNALSAYSDSDISPIETISADGEECGYILCQHVPADESTGISEQYIITGYFYISDDTFINVTYSFLGNSEELKEAALNSLRTFAYYSE